MENILHTALTQQFTFGQTVNSALLNVQSVVTYVIYYILCVLGTFEKGALTEGTFGKGAFTDGTFEKNAFVDNTSGESDHEVYNQNL